MTHKNVLIPEAGTTENRWAAFTTDELYLIHERIVMNRSIASKQPQHEREMLDQLEAEIKLRHAKLERREHQKDYCGTHGGV